MEYGMELFHTAIKSAWKKLEIIQSTCLRLACGAMCSTAVDSMQQECGEPPIQFRRKRAVLRNTSKISMSTKNPASKVLEDCWQLHYAKWRSGAQPLQLETKQFITSTQIPKSTIKTDAPWNKRCKMNTSLLNEIHSTDEARTKRLQVKCLLENYSKSIQIYTDASVKVTGRAGAAFCIPDFSVEAEIRIADGTSVVMGELLAINSALKFIENTDI
jgi:hypothetical protein